MTTDNKYSILLVDDEPDILEFLSYNLVKEGFKVITASNGLEAISEAKKHLPHLILLDVMMPEMDGFEACREIRKIDTLKEVVIAFLTARSEDVSLVSGLDSGADDYIIKPILPKVLISRVNALLRRIKLPHKTQLIEISDFVIDKERYVVFQNNTEYVLPRKEFDLLSLLISKPGRVFTRDEILSLVWGDEIIVGNRTIDVHIRKLREKFGNDYIKTIKGIGYKFES